MTTDQLLGLGREQRDDAVADDGAARDDVVADDGASSDDGAGPRHDPRVDGVRRVDHWIGVLIVVACCGFVFWKLHPQLLFRDTTANGGDMGAHVWLPAYLRDHVLGKWQVAGWSPDWFGGFPVGQFYFPLPSLLVVILDVFLPYNVAFKLVTAIGPIMLPAAAYAFGRGIRAPRPTPVFFALAALVFLFFKGATNAADAATKSVTFNQHIMGGTLASNLAGEYSFSIALAFALFFLGAFAVALRERRRLAMPAVLLAAVVLSHIVVAFFAVAGALVIWLFNRPLRRWKIATSIGVVAALLTAVWVVPLLVRFGFTTQMRYAKLTDYSAYLTPSYLVPALVLALLGTAVGIALLRPSTLILAALAVMFNVWFRAWPGGHIWNLRFLPFWYLLVFLLAAVGLAELARAPRAIARWVETGSFAGVEAPLAEVEEDPAFTRWFRPRYEYVMAIATTVIMVAVCCVGLVGLHRDNRKYHGFLDYWAWWNYTGYESRTGYKEYRSVIDTMNRLPPGRALWEKVVVNELDTLGAYGGDYSLMLLPYWTHGRIGSMEGLYPDGASSSPYHYLMDSHLAKNPANLVNIPPSYGVAYGPALDKFALGVKQMQAFGVRYYMAQSTEAQQLADTNLDLRLVARVPDLDGAAPHGWKVYEVAGSSAVVPLPSEPVVVRGSPGGEDWIRIADHWWEDEQALDQPFAANGPSSWRRVSRIDASSPARIARRALPAVRVRNVVQHDDSISFDVSRTGVPVVVRTSYYPNWEAVGARGPYRISPNLMVVVPTSRHVELHFRTTNVEWLGLLLFAVGLVGLVGLAMWRPAADPELEPARASGPPSSPPPPPPSGAPLPATRPSDQGEEAAPPPVALR